MLAVIKFLPILLASGVITIEVISWRNDDTLNTLMVITGKSDHNSRRGEIQMIRLSGTSSGPTECKTRMRHPISGSFIMGTLLRPEDAVLTCGDIGDARSRFCHRYDPKQDVWMESIQMLQRRSLAATVWVDSDGWWVTGGTGTQLSNSSSTEIYDSSTRSFWKGPPLPEPLQDHCLVKINATHFFIAGGETRPRNSAHFLCEHAWMYDHRTRRFQAMPSMPRKVSAASCGLAVNPAGKAVIIVAGGVVEGQESFSAQSFAFDLESLEWRQGPALPVALAAAPSVPLGQNSFLILGGYRNTPDSDFSYSKDIYEFEFYRKWWSIIFYPNTYYERWVKRDEQLIHGSARFPAFWVPDSWC